MRVWQSVFAICLLLSFACGSSQSADDGTLPGDTPPPAPDENAESAEAETGDKELVVPTWEEEIPLGEVAGEGEGEGGRQEADEPGAPAEPAAKSWSDCPKKSTLQGSAPPDGWEQYCEKRGKREGPYTKWHENGALAEEGSYKRGKRHGTVTSWQEDGTIIFKGDYKKGKKNGKWTLVYPDKTIIETWKRGKKKKIEEQPNEDAAQESEESADE